MCQETTRLHGSLSKLRLAKHNSVKEFFLPRIALKDAGQMEDALSTVVLPAKKFSDQVEDEFCTINRPQVGTSLSGSTISSTVEARLEKRTSQESTCSEKTVQNQMMVNPQQEEEKSSDDGDMFQSFQEYKEKEIEHLKNCF